MDIRFGYPSVYDSGDKSITMYFSSSVPVRESVLALAISSVFAEIGGYTGLLLGYSFLNFPQTLTFFFEKLCSFGSYVSSHCLQNNVDENVDNVDDFNVDEE